MVSKIFHIFVIQTKIHQLRLQKSRCLFGMSLEIHITWELLSSAHTNILKDENLFRAFKDRYTHSFHKCELLHSDLQLEKLILQPTLCNFSYNEQKLSVQFVL